MKTISRHSVVLDDKAIIATLKSNAINIFEKPADNLWTFDLAGKLVGMYFGGVNYRRTLNNKYYRKSRIIEDREIFRQVDEVLKSDIAPIMEHVISIVSAIIPQLPIIYQDHFSKILNNDINALKNSADDFSKIYLPISILPPDQYMSLVIQLTEGCNYNQCTFCNFYRDRPFRIKTNAELSTHISYIKNFFGSGINFRKSIFLADANALAASQARFVKALKLINNEFPQYENIYSFIDVFTGLKKDENDFKQLNQLGLKRVYLGVESGNSDLIHFLNKKQLNGDIIELTHNIKSGGLNVGIIFLVGAGGIKYSTKHLKDSIQLLEELPLTKGDIVYLSELNDTNSEYIQSMKYDNILLPNKMEIRQWSKEFKATVKGKVQKEVQVSIYDINQFFY